MIFPTSTAHTLDLNKHCRIELVQNFCRGSLIGEAIHQRSLKEEFLRNCSIWKEEVQFSSSMSEILSNRYYQNIIDLGVGVIPFILKELDERPDFWFEALQALTNVNPVPDTDLGNLPAMRKYWLAWASENKIAY